MTQLLFKNNAQTLLANGITSVATSMVVAAGTGVLFPAPAGGQGFYCTLVQAANNLINEIVLVTNVTGDTMTIVRGQDGTTPLTWNANDIVAQLVTAGDLSSFLQISTAYGRLIGFPLLVTSSTGTLVFPASTNLVLGFMVGGGGGGGTAAATGSGQSSAGAGGNSGGYTEVATTTSFQGSAITIGSGGTAGVAGNPTVWTCGSAVFSAAGGAAGGASGAITPPGIAIPGATTPPTPVTGEYFATLGEAGSPGVMLSATVGYNGNGGQISRFGSGGAYGAAGFGYGAGGGGGWNPQNAGSPVPGGTGFPGCALFYAIS